MSRLIGFLKEEEKVNVSAMKMVPVTEKHEATRSVVSRARKCPGVNLDAMSGMNVENWRQGNSRT